MNQVTEAVELFRQGCACSQAILGVYGPAFGIDRGIAMRLAAGFAGGMRQGETCGAVTGAFMVLGLEYCSAGCEAAAGRQAVYAAVRELATRFRERHGTLVCRELLGCDLTTPEGTQQARDRDLFRTVCPGLVESAARILEEMAAERESSSRSRA